MSHPADLETTLRVIRERRDDVRRRLSVELLGVFGSLARQEAKPESDVDILADFLKGTTLFRVSQAQEELEQAVGRRVDLVDRSRLKSFGRPSIEQDFIPA